MGRARTILSLYNIPSEASFPPSSYYTKRAYGACGDTRLAVLPSDLFKERRVLDIGCNEGVVTIEIGAFLLSDQTFSPTFATEFSRRARLHHLHLLIQVYSPTPCAFTHRRS